MKTVGYTRHVTRWHLAVVLGVLVPNFALGAKAQEACESQAKATFKKKAVEVAMASIVGNLSEIEAVSEREGLQRRLENEKANCVHVMRAANSYSAEASSGAL